MTDYCQQAPCYKSSVRENEDVLKLKALRRKRKLFQILMFLRQNLCGNYQS